jgi:S1-C subfamily serine protease
MRKYVNRLLIILFIMLPVTAYGASLVTANYPILVNGEKVNIQAYNLDGTTLLPIRAVSDALGVPITWNNVTRSVEINTLDVDKLKESTVMIYADDGKTQVQGSAVAIDYDQYLTAYHVVDENRSNVKTSDKAQLTIDDFDSTIDIATLNSSAKVKPVKIGDSDEVKVGDKVVVISSPKGAGNTVTYATVQEPSSKGIVIWGNLDNGSSGGGVFNLSGQLIGVVISGSGFDKAFLVIPINEIREAL